jgi:hypothetical protein
VGLLGLLAATLSAQEDPRDRRLQELEDKVRRLEEQNAKLLEYFNRKNAAQEFPAEVELEKAMAVYIEKLEATRQEGAEGKLKAPGLRSLSFGGQVRVRGEYRSDFDLGGEIPGPGGTTLEADHDNFALLRTRLHAAAEVTDQVAGFIQVQDSRYFGEEASAGSLDPTVNSLDNLDLKQGWLDLRDLFGSGFTTRIGRQTLAYGDHRLVGDFDWDNQGRSFDALRLFTDRERWAFDLFAADIRDEDPGRAQVGASPSHDEMALLGAYLRLKSLKESAGIPELDGYVFYLHDDNESGSGVGKGGTRLGTENVNLWTLGTRILGALAGGTLEYTGEVAGQFGENSGLSVTGAWAFHAAGFFHLAKVAPDWEDWAPVIGAGYSLGTGDRDPDDSRLSTFHNLFPTNHLHYGYIDFVSWSNSRDAYVRFECRPLRQLTLTTEYHWFRLYTDEDFYYGSSGSPTFGFLAPGAGNNLGHELDLKARYDWTRSVVLQGGWSHFFPRTYFRNAIDGSDGADWFYLMAVVSF